METTINPFEKYQEEYWKKKTSKTRKGEILDAVSDLTGMHRKAIVRKFRILQLRDEVDKQTRLTRPGRPTIYGSEATTALKELWSLADKLCGELLHPMIGEYIEQCKTYGSWKYGEETETKLRCMSVSTVKRRVKIFFKKDRETFRKGKTTTHPSSIKTIIPIRDTSWFEAKTGDGQIDTVVHCGDELSGNMAYTLNFTDFKTYWIGLRAQMNKGQHATVNSLLYIKEYQLPFPMLSVHPDTGSEFVNWHMKAICDSLGIDMTRSRANHKNDNMCVEERNGHVIRKKIGYIRIDCKESVEQLNRYYDKLCLLFNHFIAVRRTKEKDRVGSRYRRVFEKPRTPYMMVMESDDVSYAEKQKLKEVHESLSIFSLKEEMKKFLEEMRGIQRRKRGKLF
jgi:hypothetical protein